MSITKVEYQRVFNLGNYENERLSFEATVEEGENPGQVLDQLRVLTDVMHTQFEAERKRAAEDAYKRQQEEWARQREEHSRQQHKPVMADEEL